MDKIYPASVGGKTDLTLFCHPECTFNNRILYCKCSWLRLPSANFVIKLY